MEKITKSYKFNCHQLNRHFASKICVILNGMKLLFVLCAVLCGAVAAEKLIVSENVNAEDIVLVSKFKV